MSKSYESKWKKFVNKMDDEGLWSDVEGIEEVAYDKAIEALQKEGYTEEESRDENIQEQSQTYKQVYSDEVHEYSYGNYSWNELPQWVKYSVMEHWAWKEID